MSTLEIRQHKSAIGEKIAAKGTLQALGLGRPGSTVRHEDSVTVRGMLRRVKHLVEVTEEKKRATSDVRPGPGLTPAGAPAPTPGAAEPQSKVEKR